MLTLTQSVGQSILIGRDIRISVISIDPEYIILHICSGIGRYPIQLAAHQPQKVYIYDNICIEVRRKRFRPQQVQISIDAPERYKILRAEIAKGV